MPRNISLSLKDVVVVDIIVVEDTLSLSKIMYGTLARCYSVYIIIFRAQHGINHKSIQKELIA